MTSLFHYLLKINISLCVLYMVYRLFFSRTTFHGVNRFILLFILVLSVIIPGVDYNMFRPSDTNFAIAEWIEHIDYYQPILYSMTEPVSLAQRLSPSILLFMLYLVGLIVMLWRFFAQLYAMKQLRKKAKKVLGQNLFLTEKGTLPFTFFRSIYLPSEMYRKGVDSHILQHEQAHANQWHSLDILIAELFCIIFWFNPFVFLLKRSLKTVHEYLADEVVASTSSQKVNYLELLVEGISPKTVHGVSSNFYWLTIKKRINMITKNKSSRLYKLAYILLIPVIALLVQSFSESNVGLNPEVKMNGETESNNIPSIKPIADANIVKISSGYGMRMHPFEKVEKMHSGVDFVAKTGTPVVSTADGVVVKVEYKEANKGYGRMVLVQHGQHYATRYTQLSAFKVNEGDEVKAGDVVGLVGSSGISTGPHLHYEVIKDGEHVDPSLFFGE